jgi:hypothetical protein
MADFIRAYEKVAAYPITKVTRVTTTSIIFDRKARPVTVARTATDAPAAAKPSRKLTTDTILKVWDFTKPAEEKDGTSPAIDAAVNCVHPVPKETPAVKTFEISAPTARRLQCLSDFFTNWTVESWDFTAQAAAFDSVLNEVPAGPELFRTFAAPEKPRRRRTTGATLIPLLSRDEARAAAGGA